MNAFFSPHQYSKIRRWLATVLPIAVGLLTTLVIVTNPPSATAFNNFTVKLLAYGVLMTLTHVFPVVLTDTELNVGYIVGMIAFLSLPAEAADTMLAALLLGAIFGGGIGLLRSRLQLSSRRPKPNTVRNVIFGAAGVTLSFYFAGLVYTSLNGSLPINRATTSWFALIAYCVVYSSLYLAILLLEAFCERRSIQQIVRINFWAFLTLIFIPTPVAVLAADVARDADHSGFAILSLGLALITIGLHAYSRSEFRLRRQLDELRSLSVVTQAMRAHLNLDTLLKTVYLQVANLLEAENFLVALYDPEEKMLEFPLAIRQGIQEEYANRSKDSLDRVLLNRVLETRAPLLLSDEVYEQARALGLHVPYDVLYSWLGVPLMAGGHVLGAIVVSSRNTHQHFGPDDLRLLNTIAASASIAIENAQLYQRQTERSNRLATLNNVTALLTGTLSPDAVLDTIISSASTIGKANAVAVYLLMDEEQPKLSFARYAGVSEKFALHTPMPVLTEINDAKGLHRQPPIVINDASHDKRAAPFQTIMVSENKSAWIELPLAVGETGLGVLAVYYNDTQTPDSENVELLRTFAAQASQAINNARLYKATDETLERRVEQLFSLAAMGRMLTATLDTKQISDVVLNYASDATKASFGLIALRDENREEMQVLSQRGYPENLLRDPKLVLEGLYAQVLENAQISRSGNVRQLAGYLPLAPAARSQLVVPILQGKEVIGAIRLESEKPEAFSEEDSYFVGQLANQTVIAIENARLFKRISEARDRLQVLLDAMEEAIVLIDETGYIVLANPRVDLIGLQPSQLLDENINVLLRRDSLKLAERMGFQSGENLHQLVQNLASIQTWPDSEPTLYHIQAQHGMVYIQRQVIPVRDNKGNTIGALLIFYNKTEEQELSRTREELSQMIVHDLRSPLTAVTTSLRLLRELVPPDSEFRTVVESTTEASQRAIRKLLSRVDALLDISKMESGQLTLDNDPSELATIVDSVCVELSPLAHELDVNVSSQVPEDLPLLDMDADKVERVLLNLLDNALKYSPTDSKVVIRAHLPGTQGAREYFVRIDVADSGPGIPADYKERLFERFVQIEGRRKVRRGVGLGLTFCKLVVEAHGGRIWIEDNPSGGSIFAFTLPVSRLGLIQDAVESK